MFIRKAIISILLVVMLVISLTAGIVSAQATDDGIEQFVSRMYTHVLNRNVDRNYSGLQFWSNRIRSGTESASSVAHGFFFSNEFVRANHSNAEFINRLYRAILGREADSRGFAYWTNHMNRGMSRESVLAGFVDSREFGNLTRQFGLDRVIQRRTRPPRVHRAVGLHYEGGLVSSFILPDRRLTNAERQMWIDDYYALGGPRAVELETIRGINRVRAEHGLSQLAIDPALMRAARYFAQQAYDLQGLHTGSHNFGPYATNPSAQHGASANVASAFGGRLRWNGGNWFSSGSLSADFLVNGWMNSPGHRAYILSPEHRFIGVGQFPGGISYMFLAPRSS